MQAISSSLTIPIKLLHFAAGGIAVFIGVRLLSDCIAPAFLCFCLAVAVLIHFWYKILPAQKVWLSPERIFLKTHGSITAIAPENVISIKRATCTKRPPIEITYRTETGRVELLVFIPSFRQNGYFSRSEYFIEKKLAHWQNRSSQ
jgi:hypothetical protein